MITCESMRDRMPEVAAGRATWTEQEARHLQDCATCPGEWDIITAVRRLGAEVEPAVDPARIGQAVLLRLREERRAVQARRRWMAGFALAAGIALMVWAGTPPRSRPGARAGAGEAFVIPVAELDSLTSTQLQTVLESLDEPLGETSTTGAPALGDLDDQQLERVLRSLEG